MPESVTGLLKYWQLLSAVGAILVAGAAAQVRIDWLQDDINEIKANGAREVRQWQKLGEHDDQLAVHETRLKDIQQHMGPAAIQEYGEIKATVRRNDRRLDEHIRDHRDDR